MYLLLQNYILQNVQEVNHWGPVHRAIPNPGISSLEAKRNLSTSVLTCWKGGMFFILQCVLRMTPWNSNSFVFLKISLPVSDGTFRDENKGEEGRGVIPWMCVNKGYVFRLFTVFNIICKVSRNLNFIKLLPIIGFFNACFHLIRVRGKEAKNNYACGQA